MRGRSSKGSGGAPIVAFVWDKEKFFSAENESLKAQILALGAQLALLEAVAEAARQSLYISSDEARAKLQGTLSAYDGYFGEEGE